ncbi:hypothetical protein AX16_007765 [Volvariella volvacea WC 439]|nr:hypothetical protein AX16_007765 [Volvariella volvacea WC 439]
MRLSSISFALLTTTFTTLANAQYFSAGWSPGEPVPAADDTVAPQPTAYDPSANNGHTDKQGPQSLSSLFDMKNILGSRPSVALFARFGINITERLATQFDNMWDERIPLITDDNYEDVIAREQFESEEEERNRLWLLVVTVTASKQEGLSKIVDSVFDTAYNDTLIAGDLPHVRWGRIDYLNVTYLTTKWGLWQAPYLVILHDRGQTLRFYRAQNLRLRPETLRQFLLTDGWKATPHWASSFAPGGEREYIMDFLATWLTKIYNITILVPRWVLFLVSGSIGSLVIGLMHRGGGDDAKKTQQKTTKQVQSQSQGQGQEQATLPSTPNSKAAKSSATTTGRVDSPHSAKKSPAKRRK